jgi:hypothetical protein
MFVLIIMYSVSINESESLHVFSGCRIRIRISFSSSPFLAIITKHYNFSFKRGKFAPKIATSSQDTHSL